MLDHPADSSSRYPAARFMFYLAKMLKEKGYVGGCIAMLRTAADLGCSDSMVLLGDILVDGGQADKKEAMDYFVKASELGNDMGMRNAGYCYALGIGCEKDKKAAAEWYLMAAEKGNARAQCNIGVLYEYGHGVPQDFREAARWYRESAERGCSRGQTNYACMLIEGKGVNRDTAEAIERLERSGSPRALRILGQIYLNGNGVPEDRELAIKFLEKSSEKDAKAKVLLAEIVGKTTSG